MYFSELRHFGNLNNPMILILTLALFGLLNKFN